MLNAVKVSSENAKELRPAIESTAAALGAPVAIMRDLGSAGAKAVAGYRRQAIPDLVCHYHFLAAAGKKLLDIEYAALRSQLRRSKVRNGAARTVLNHPRAAPRRAGSAGPAGADPAGPGGRGTQAPAVSLRPAPLGFLPALRTVPATGATLAAAAAFASRTERRLLKQALAVLAALGRADRIAWALPRLERSWAVFSELRDA